MASSESLVGYEVLTLTRALALTQARMSQLAGAKPRTAEEKAKAYGDDLIAQIGQADAMDERLAEKIKKGQSW